MDGLHVKVLLIEDDEDDYVLVKDLLSEISVARFDLEWVADYESALEQLERERHDVYLLDYRLGPHSGLDLLREMLQRGCAAPIILLTGQGDFEVDLEAMRIGAADYLIKGQINAPLLERSIRYSIERKLVERELRAYRYELEELVQRRTSQLEEANRQLRLEVAERKRVEDALRESEGKYRAIVEAFDGFIYICSPENRIEFMNEQLIRRTGYDATGESCCSVFHGRDFMCPSCISEPPSREEITRWEVQSARDNRWYLIINTPIFHAGGTVSQQTMIMDITERKKAEEALRESEERYRRIVDTAQEGIWITDAGCTTTYINQRMADMLGYSVQEMLGRPVWRFMHETARSEAEKHLERRRQGIREQLDFKFQRKDGSDLWTIVSSNPILDDRGRFIGALSMVTDITDRKRAEEAVRKSAERIKLFAYSVSHDLKSPAVGLYGLTRLLHKQYRNVLDEKGRHFCDQIMKISEQVVALVDKINLFISTRQSPLHVEPMKLHELFQMVRDEFAAQLKLRSIQWIGPGKVPEIRADRVGLGRVFTNLVDNALKYGGEELSEIRIEYHQSDEHHILSVSDNGVGIKQENAQKIFKLFEREETSKGTAGMGLGLAIVKEIAEQHNGGVWVEPNGERGIKFCVAISKYL